MPILHHADQAYPASLYHPAAISVSLPLGLSRNMPGSQFQAQGWIGYRVDPVIALRFYGQEIEVEDNNGMRRRMSVRAVQFDIVWCSPLDADS